MTTELATSEHTAIVMPIAPVDDLVRAMHQYALAKERLLTDSDYQVVSDKQRFIKKSGWVKLSLAFGVSTHQVDEEWTFDDTGLLIRAKYRVRAVAPSGRYAEGIGVCSIREPRFTDQESGALKPNAIQKLEHDIPATAFTRARNAACAALFGQGEVSWEEATADGMTHQPISHGSTSTQGKTSKLASEKQLKWVRGLLSDTGHTADLDGLTMDEFNVLKDSLTAEKNGGPTAKHPRLGNVNAETGEVVEDAEFRAVEEEVPFENGGSDEPPTAAAKPQQSAPAATYKPASANQLATISKLCRLLGHPEDESMGDMTVTEASDKITKLSREYNERKGVSGQRSA